MLIQVFLIHSVGTFTQESVRTAVKAQHAFNNHSTDIPTTGIGKLKQETQFMLPAAELRAHSGDLWQHSSSAALP